MSFLRLLLVLAVFCAPIVEAGHSSEVDCEELNCLVCHANADEDQNCSSHLSLIALKPAESIFSHRELLVDKALNLHLPIRGPPQQERGEYVWAYSKDVFSYPSVQSCFVFSYLRLCTPKIQIVKTSIVWSVMPVWTRLTRIRNSFSSLISLLQI